VISIFFYHVTLTFFTEKRFKISENLARYRFENNFVGPSKQLCIEHLNVDDNAAKSF